MNQALNQEPAVGIEPTTARRAKASRTPTYIVQTGPAGGISTARARQNPENDDAKPDPKRILAESAEKVHKGARLAVGVDLIALAEAVLFPGIDPRALSWPQQRQAERLAKAHLVALGKWPPSEVERRDADRLGADTRRRGAA